MTKNKKENNNISKKTIFLIVFVFLFILLVGLLFFKSFFKDNNLGESDSSLEHLGTIAFEKEKYTCKVGESLTTMIKTSIESDDNTLYQMPTVSFYYSDNPRIVTIEPNDDLQLNCINCQLYKITCNEKGKSVLNAVSSTGVKTSVSIEVLDNEQLDSSSIGTIAFDEESYKCKVGEEITTKITTYMLDEKEETNIVIPTIKSYSSKDKKIATIELNKDMQLKCINCGLFKITCLKAGKTTLETISSTGASKSVPITVE